MSEVKVLIPPCKLFHMSCSGNITEVRMWDRSEKSGFCTEVELVWHCFLSYMVNKPKFLSEMCCFIPAGIKQKKSKIIFSFDPRRWCEHDVCCSLSRSVTVWFWWIMALFDGETCSSNSDRQLTSCWGSCQTATGGHGGGRSHDRIWVDCKRGAAAFWISCISLVADAESPAERDLQ